MPTKNKKNPMSEPIDTIAFIAKAVQDSAITIFWESVDRLKQEVKVKVEIGFQYLLGAIAVLVGLIFILVGLSDFLEEIIGTKGIGMILTGILVTLGGIWVGEKTKQLNQ